MGVIDLHEFGVRRRIDHRIAGEVAIDELILDIVPVLLGSGERLFDGVSDPGLKPVEVIESPHATHIGYSIGR